MQVPFKIELESNLFNSISFFDKTDKQEKEERCVHVWMLTW